MQVKEESQRMKVKVKDESEIKKSLEMQKKGELEKIINNVENAKCSHHNFELN